MGCNCGKKGKEAFTSAQAEAMRQQAEFNDRVAAETAKSASGEHG